MPKQLLSTVLIVDDDPEFVRRINEFLTPYGYRIHWLSSPEQALEYLRSAPQGILAVLLDIMFGEQPRGLEALPEFIALPSAPPVVMLSAYERATLVECAIKQGAESYVPKANLETLPERLENFQRHRLQRLKHPLTFLRQFGIVTCSEKMREVAEKIMRCAPTELTVLIVGETGTGKSLVAEALHRYSRRAQQRFVAVDIPNIVGSPELFARSLFGTAPGAGAPASRGFLHEADGGTLFLDEIGELSWEQQSQLLKPIEEKRFYRVGSTQVESTDVRILSATNRNISQMVDSAKFRRDLYERLTHEIIYLPPLRERPEDIPELANHFARTLPQEIWGAASSTPSFTLAQPTLERLQQYRWEGNVRELRNVIQRCLTIAQAEHTDTITPRILNRALAETPSSHPTPSSAQTLEEVRLDAIHRALSQTRGNVTRAAQQLGISREHLHRLVKKHGIDPNQYRQKHHAD